MKNSENILQYASLFFPFVGPPIGPGLGPLLALVFDLSVKNIGLLPSSFDLFSNRRIRHSHRCFYGVSQVSIWAGLAHRTQEGS